MSHSLKKITTRLSSLTNLVLIIFCFLTLSCAQLKIQHQPTNETKILTERDVLFEKGKALILAREFSKAESIFLNLTLQNINPTDQVYDESLWYLSLIYEKVSLPEKSILTLLQLDKLNSKYVSPFKIKASLMKNYYRINNANEALKYKKSIEAEKPNIAYSTDQLYNDLIETLDLNYDYSFVQELIYVGQIQKYLLYIMEQNESIKNEKVTQLLIAIYDYAYLVLNKDSIQKQFKVDVATTTLSQLRTFDQLKLNDLNLNLNTVARFSNYSEQKQIQITDWLHK